MLYISIESRKGGVGKTTTALSLAEALLSFGYRVLIVDMDIVGTTIDTSFITAHRDLIHEVELRGHVVNLVRLFKDLYMAGENIPSFAKEDEHRNNAFTYCVKKCKLIGSNIYDKTDGTTPLEDPRILYDAYHSYWLLEFVKGISNSFAKAADKDTKVAIILDNSPGFSSIENSIHDYLTDLGPEEGKVLLVSTIDPQDITACRQSKSIIEKRFNDKVEAGKYYHDMTEGKAGRKIKSPDFEAVWNSLCASGGRQPAYHSCYHHKVPPFVSILVNKVPKDIFKQLFAKGILHKETETATPFQDHLLYYFSNPQLTTYEIAHQMVHSDRFNKYSQSTKMEEIDQDNARYQEFCDFSRQIGLDSFFKKEWAPLARFNDLLDVMKRRELLKEEPDGKIWKKGDVDGASESQVSFEINVVTHFVETNLRDTNQLNELLPTIREHVSFILTQIDGRQEIDFHSDRPMLQEIGDFVTSFGLAVYRLHIYGQASEMLNSLMNYCLEDKENVEKIDKDAIANWVDNILEGRVVVQDMVGALTKMLNNRKNARELNNALQGIVKSWGLLV